MKSKTLIQRLKTGKLKQLGFFMLLAFLFFVFSKLTTDYKQNLKLKIQLTNLDEEIILINDSLNYINTFVEAKGFTLMPYQWRSQKTIKINAKQQLKSLKNTYQFIFNENRYLIENELGSSFKILTAKPDTLVIPYQKESTKYVPIKLQSEIQFTAGFDMPNQAQLSVDSVKLIGPKLKLDSINSIETSTLKLKNLSQPVTKTLNLTLPNTNKIKVIPNQVNVSINTQRYTEGTLKVPITIKNVPQGKSITYFPKNVTITYYVALKDYNTITADNFKVTCNFLDLSANNPPLKPQLSYKGAIKRAKIVEKKIEVIIR